MFDWDACLYLKFSNERTQPAMDLAARIPTPDPKRIVDVGCGPGNSTFILARKYKGAYVLGIDNSRPMIVTARATHPELDWKLCDAATDLPSLGRDFDVVFSNACLQWVPDHGRVLADMMYILRPGGTLAVQVPCNQEEPVKRFINETASSARWKERLEGARPFYTLTAAEYYDILQPLAASVTLWETAYFHVLDSRDDILEWYRGTALRPYYDQLSEAEREDFEAELREGIRQCYPAQASGRVLFRFPRLFFIAQK